MPQGTEPKGTPLLAPLRRHSQHTSSPPPPRAFLPSSLPPHTHSSYPSLSPPRPSHFVLSAHHPHVTTTTTPRTSHPHTRPCITYRLPATPGRARTPRVPNAAQNCRGALLPLGTPDRPSATAEETQSEERTTEKKKRPPLPRRASATTSRVESWWLAPSLHAVRGYAFLQAYRHAQLTTADRCENPLFSPAFTQHPANHSALINETSRFAVSLCPRFPSRTRDRMQHCVACQLSQSFATLTWRSFTRPTFMIFPTSSRVVHGPHSRRLTPFQPPSPQ